ncbi:MAG: HAMP domain-containing histidine kinase [Desulfobulbus sp.]|nr:HAMP domain-containing histidine kinase [Desulfobulbus sp.]
MKVTARIKIFLNSIKGKILALFLVALLVASGLTLLNIWTLSAVREQLNLSERYDDMLNGILEVRRYEKNLLIYGGAESLHEGLLYLDQTEAALISLSQDIAETNGPKSSHILEAFKDALTEYRKNFTVLANKQDSESIRASGKLLVDMAGQLISTKRGRIHQTIFEVSLLPFAYLGVFLALMVFLLKFITWSLLRPLSMIGKLTARVATGDFSPVDVREHHIEEVASLLDALNRMALELTAHQEDLLQARKIAAIGTLTAGVAHEMNNPLNNIVLSAETLLETHAELLDAEGRETLDDILAQAERARDIVRDLLDFSRTERASSFSPLSPEVIVKSSLALLKNNIMPAGLSVHLAIAPDLPQVDGNLRRVQQVFLNLMQNSIHATPPGGTIEISASAADDFVRFTVRDSGKGIDPEHLSHIFEPFFTTKEVGKGTGLGLAVTYSIVKRHNGRIEVESTPGAGTAFHVFLPKASSAPTTLAHRAENGKVEHSFQS